MLIQSSSLPTENNSDWWVDFLILAKVQEFLETQTHKAHAIKGDR